ncbi:MAG: sulfotransferase [Pseudomonadota bacterium]
MREYLFACGCPRSGTTALWRVLASHPAVVMGNERFILKSSADNYELRPELYEFDRFFEYREGDTHFPDLTGARRGEQYRKLREKTDTARYRGDKIPFLYRHYDQFFNDFSSARVVFIFRNIFDVASSYKARFDDVGDSWSAKVEDAIADWNHSLNASLRIFEARQNSILFIEYESLFFDTDDINQKKNRILEFLGLADAMDFRGAIKNESTYSQRLDNTRPSLLSTAEKRAIMHGADFGAYQQVLEVSSH